MKKIFMAGLIGLASLGLMSTTVGADTIVSTDDEIVDEITVDESTVFDDDVVVFDYSNYTDEMVLENYTNWVATHPDEYRAMYDEWMKQDFCDYALLNGYFLDGIEQFYAYCG